MEIAKLKKIVGVLIVAVAVLAGAATAGCGSAADDVPEGQSLRNPGGKIKGGPPVNIPQGPVSGQESAK